MRPLCWTKCLLLAGTGALIPFAGAKADEQAAGKQAVDAWLAWLDMHPLPLPENDGAEENLLRELFAQHSFADACAALVERDARREHLRLVVLLGNRDQWKRIAPTAFRPEAVAREGDRDPADFVLRTTRALLMDLSRRDPARHRTVLERELSTFEAQGAALDVARKEERFAVYRRVCELRRRILVWLDANSDFFGAYENTQAQARGELVRPKLQ